MFSIRDCFLFKGLTDEQIDHFVSMLPEPVAYPRGDVIYESEHFDKAIGIFIKGKGYAHPTVDTVLKTIFEEGSVFGAAAMFEAGPRYVSVIRAKYNSEIVFISEELLKSMFAEEPKIMMNYIVFLSNRIRYLNQKLGQMMGISSKSRVLRFLTDNADSDGRVKPLSSIEMAKLANIGRTTFYRCLDELEADGYLIREENRIELLKY